jgi:HEAT repeat protein
MSPSKTEATELTNGWALLTEGKVDQALIRADRVLATNPRSVAAFVLGVEAELARSGSTAALARYEGWIGARAFEEPSVLRRIASGVLRELADPAAKASTRLEALRALVEDGDTAAAVALQQGVKTSSLAEARVLASMGDETAVKLLITDLTRSAGRGMTSIEALGASGSSLAVAALSEHLTHGLPEIRAAAVEGLGKLGAKYNTASRIKPLLNDSTSYVRVKAAAALYALGDMSGLRILQDLAAQESPAGRLMAAQAMASQPGGEWQEAVRQLTSAPQPEVRVGAARLLLPHQPEVARRVLEAAMNDPNPAIRSMASESMVEALPVGDLRALRQMLKTADNHVRVRAAARLLEVLR